MKNSYQLPCNIAQTLNILGDKWTLLVVQQIRVGRNTYQEIRSHLDGIPSNLLSERLRGLEEDGIIQTSLYQKHPPRYEYTLTDSGMDLADVLNSLILWGEKHLETCKKQLIHIECGYKVEQCYICSSCGKIVERDQIHIEEVDM